MAIPPRNEPEAPRKGLPGGCKREKKNGALSAKDENSARGKNVSHMSAKKTAKLWKVHYQEGREEGTTRVHPQREATEHRYPPRGAGETNVSGSSLCREGFAHTKRRQRTKSKEPGRGGVKKGRATAVRAFLVSGEGKNQDREKTGELKREGGAKRKLPQ